MRISVFFLTVFTILTVFTVIPLIIAKKGLKCQDLGDMIGFTA